MAWWVGRSEPAPLSLVLITTKFEGGISTVAARHGENSEVFPAGSVAVAVICPPCAVTGRATLKLVSPLPSVVTLVDPR